MPRDDYDPEERDRGEPPRRGAAAAGPAVTRQVGPLPVWGWGVVVIAGVFLWRRIGGNKVATQQAASAVGAVPYQTAGGGGVYVIPGGTGTAPAPTPTYEPQWPVGAPGAATGACPPGTVLIQGPNGHTCGTAADAIQLGKYLQAVGAK